MGNDVSLKNRYYNFGQPEINDRILFLNYLFFVSVDVVAKGFLELLQDDEKAGEVMRITVKNGIDYHNFPKEQVPF